MREFLLKHGFKLNEYENQGKFWEKAAPAADCPTYDDIFQCTEEFKDFVLYLDGWVEHVSEEEFVKYIEKRFDTK